MSLPKFFLKQMKLLYFLFFIRYSRDTELPRPDLSAGNGRVSPEGGIQYQQDDYRNVPHHEGGRASSLQRHAAACCAVHESRHRQSFYHRGTLKHSQSKCFHMYTQTHLNTYHTNIHTVFNTNNCISASTFYCIAQMHSGCQVQPAGILAFNLSVQALFNQLTLF